MITADLRVMAEDIARAAVAELAPSELTDFHETVAEYWRNPRRVRNLYREDDDMLGFGGLEVAVVAPAALYIATEVVKFCSSQRKADWVT